ncbi:MAG: helix-turn-helix domain-containing protein [Devosia sp.]
MAEDKRRKVLTASAALFHKHGLRGTSMEAIAKQAGIAKPTLYAYFADKEAVFSALLESLITGWRAAFLAGLGSDGDAVARIGAALVNKQKAVMRLLASSPHAAELYSAHRQPSGHTLAAFDAEIAATIERELTLAGAMRARSATQLLLAAASGVAQHAQSVAELGPAIRLLTERLLRPELP